MINSGLLTNQVNIDHLCEFSKRMQSILDLNLNEVLSKALSSEDLVTLRKGHHPFLNYKPTSVSYQNDTEENERRAKEAVMAKLSSHPVHLKTRNGKT